MKRQLRKLTVMKATGFICLIFICLSSTVRSQDSGKLKIKGDIRYRHELIDEENVDRRIRPRMRTRLNLNAQATDDLNIVFQLAGGGDSPVSTNQDLGKAFSTKDIRLDMAYFDWKCPKLKGLNVIGGKVKYPFYSVGKSQLLWDTDVRPEGLSAKYTTSRNSFEILTGLYTFIVDERKAGDDTWLVGGQGGFKYTASSFYVTGVAGYYTFTETKGNPSFYNASKSMGNSVDADGNYTNDFNDVQAFGEIGTKSFGFPTAIHADFVVNTGADEDNQAYLIGFTLKPNSWSFLYDYRHLEKDAVIGALTESDFLGGGSNGQGHKFVVGYTVSKSVKLGATYYFDKKNLDNEVDYHRLQLDIVTSF